MVHKLVAHDNFVQGTYSVAEIFHSKAQKIGVTRSQSGWAQWRSLFIRTAPADPRVRGAADPGSRTRCLKIFFGAKQWRVL